MAVWEAKMSFQTSNSNLRCTYATRVERATETSEESTGNVKISVKEEGIFLPTYLTFFFEGGR